MGSNLTDPQFLYIDLFILIPLSIFMGQTESYKTLTPHLRAGSLLSLPVLTSVIGSVLIQAGFQVFIFFYVRTWKEFYKPFEPKDEDDKMCYENTSVVFISNFQYLITCMVFSISKPFRQPIYTNLWFTLSLVLLFAMNLYSVMSSDPFITSLLDYEQDVSFNFRIQCLLLIVVNSLLTYGYERVVVWYVSLWEGRRQERKVLQQQRL
jgi:cation-transporting ATPase 13A2